MKAARGAVMLLAAALLLSACAAAPKEGAETAETGGTELDVHFFDAGAADAILLTTAQSAVLIDTGEKGFGKTILAYLEERGVERLDALIVTHFDRDHVGGAAKVLGGVGVDRVLQSNCPQESKAYEKYVKALQSAGIEPVTVQEELRFTLDGVRYIVNPPRQAVYDSHESNNSSLIVRVENGANRFLFTGDAMTERLREFLSGGDAACDVLKLPHHGRDEALLGALLDAAKPAYAVITSSSDEPESKAVVRALEDAGVRVLLTRDGAVSFHSDGATLTPSR